jgi:hypothetical protein
MHIEPGWAQEVTPRHDAGRARVERDAERDDQRMWRAPAGPGVGGVLPPVPGPGGLRRTAPGGFVLATRLRDFRAKPVQDFQRSGYPLGTMVREREYDCRMLGCDKLDVTINEEAVFEIDTAGAHQVTWMIVNSHGEKRCITQPKVPGVSTQKICVKFDRRGRWYVTPKYWRNRDQGQPPLFLPNQKTCTYVVDVFEVCIEDVEYACMVPHFATVRLKLVHGPEPIVGLEDCEPGSPSGVTYFGAVAPPGCAPPVTQTMAVQPSTAGFQPPRQICADDFVVSGNLDPSAAYEWGLLGKGQIIKPPVLAVGGVAHDPPGFPLTVNQLAPLWPDRATHPDCILQLDQETITWVSGDGCDEEKDLSDLIVTVPYPQVGWPIDGRVINGLELEPDTGMVTEIPEPARMRYSVAGPEFRPQDLPFPALPTCKFSDISAGMELCGPRESCGVLEVLLGESSPLQPTAPPFWPSYAQGWPSCGYNPVAMGPPGRMDFGRRYGRGPFVGQGMGTPNDLDAPCSLVDFGTLGKLSPGSLPLCPPSGPPINMGCGRVGFEAIWHLEDRERTTGNLGIDPQLINPDAPAEGFIDCIPPAPPSLVGGEYVDLECLYKEPVPVESLVKLKLWDDNLGPRENDGSVRPPDAEANKEGPDTEVFVCLNKSCWTADGNADARVRFRPCNATGDPHTRCLSNMLWGVRDPASLSYPAYVPDPLSPGQPLTGSFDSVSPSGVVDDQVIELCSLISRSDLDGPFGGRLELVAGNDLDCNGVLEACEVTLIIVIRPVYVELDIVRPPTVPVQYEDWLMVNVDMDRNATDVNGLAIIDTEAGPFTTLPPTDDELAQVLVRTYPDGITGTLMFNFDPRLRVHWLPSGSPLYQVLTDGTITPALAIPAGNIAGELRIEALESSAQVGDINLRTRFTFDPHAPGMDVGCSDQLPLTATIGDLAVTQVAPIQAVQAMAPSADKRTTMRTTVQWSSPISQISSGARLDAIDGQLLFDPTVEISSLPHTFDRLNLPRSQMIMYKLNVTDPTLPPEMTFFRARRLLTELAVTGLTDIRTLPTSIVPVIQQAWRNLQFEGTDTLNMRYFKPRVPGPFTASAGVNVSGALLETNTSNNVGTIGDDAKTPKPGGLSVVYMIGRMTTTAPHTLAFADHHKLIAATQTHFKALMPTGEASIRFNNRTASMTFTGSSLIDFARWIDTTPGMFPADRYVVILPNGVLAAAHGLPPNTPMRGATYYGFDKAMFIDERDADAPTVSHEMVHTICDSFFDVCHASETPAEGWNAYTGRVGPRNGAKVDLGLPGTLFEHMNLMDEHEPGSWPHVPYYEELMDFFLVEAHDPPILEIHGHFNADDSVVLDPLWIRDGFTLEDGESNVIVRIRDVVGTLLQESGLRLAFSSVHDRIDATAEEISHFNGRVLMPAGAATIEVLRDDVVYATVPIDGQAPTGTIHSIVDVTNTLRNMHVTFADADSEELWWNLAYWPSTEGPAIPLGEGTAAVGEPVDIVYSIAGLPGSSAGVLHLAFTDALNTGEEFEDMPLPNQAPMLQVQSVTSAEGDVLGFHATAVDAEDGTLFVGFVWETLGGVVLGTLDTLATPLAADQLRVSITDSNGVTTQVIAGTVLIP